MHSVLAIFQPISIGKPKNPSAFLRNLIILDNSNI